jgi:undecaprenyl-diphosphatase
MTDYFYAALLGIIQGLTEFWPVSSSGHLVIAHDLLKFGFVDDLTFDVALHMGTLVAVVAYFWHDIIAFVIAFFQSLRNWNVKNDFNQRMAWFILVASIPAGIGGFLLEKWADTTFRSLWLVSGFMAAVGLLFIIVERFAPKRKEIEEMGWGTAILIGCAQVLALLPGTSRSGITTVAGLAQGMKRSAAARFSFLLSAPVIFGAGLKKMGEAYKIGLTSHQWLVMLTGAITAGIVGYFAIRTLLRFFERHSLNVFAYYRLLLAAVVIIVLVISS